MAVVLGVGYGADAPGAALGEVEGVGMARTRCGQARLQLAVQLALATAVLGQNMGHGAGLLADLMQCLAMTEASSGMRNTVTPPAATSTEAVCWLMASAETATLVTATMMGSAVVQ